MNTASSNLNIVHKPEIGRFEAMVNGLRCEADYLLDGHIMRMTHTGVPAQLEGKGIAAALVKAALTWARAQGHQVDPIWSVVAIYIKRQPGWQDLVA